MKFKKVSESKPLCPHFISAHDQLSIPSSQRLLHLVYPFFFISYVHSFISFELDNIFQYTQILNTYTLINFLTSQKSSTKNVLKSQRSIDLVICCYQVIVIENEISSGYCCLCCCSYRSHPPRTLFTSECREQ